jgi:hypothetical protein
MILQKFNKFLLIIIAIVIIFIIVNTSVKPYPELNYGAVINGLSVSNLNLSKQLGIIYSRQDIKWSIVENVQGFYDFSSFDPGVELYIKNNVTPLFILDYTNKFYVTPPQYVIDYNLVNRFKAIYVPENDLEFQLFKKAFGDFVYHTVLHYKGKINYFEIWNEPWASGFWYPKPNAVRYTELLKEAYTRGKQANPEAKFVIDVSIYSFTQTMYQYGAKDYFDIMGMHPYCGYGAVDPSDYVKCPRMGDIQKIRDLAKTYGDKDKEMWVTEMGIPSVNCNSTGGNCNPNNTLEFQEFFLNRTIYSIKKNYPFITRIYWYDLKNDCADNWSECNFGLYYLNGTYKPSGIEYRRIIQEDK